MQPIQPAAMQPAAMQDKPPLAMPPEEDAVMDSHESALPEAAAAAPAAVAPESAEGKEEYEVKVAPRDTAAAVARSIQRSAGALIAFAQVLEKRPSEYPYLLVKTNQEGMEELSTMLYRNITREDWRGAPCNYMNIYSFLKDKLPQIFSEQALSDQFSWQKATKGIELFCKNFAKMASLAVPAQEAVMKERFKNEEKAEIARFNEKFVDLKERMQRNIELSNFLQSGKELEPLKRDLESFVRQLSDFSTRYIEAEERKAFAHEVSIKKTVIECFFKAVSLPVEGSIRIDPSNREAPIQYFSAEQFYREALDTCNQMGFTALSSPAHLKGSLLEYITRQCKINPAVRDSLLISIIVLQRSLQAGYSDFRMKMITELQTSVGKLPAVDTFAALRGSLSFLVEAKEELNEERVLEGKLDALKKELWKSILATGQTLSKMVEPLRKNHLYCDEILKGIDSYRQALAKERDPSNVSDIMRVFIRDIEHLFSPQSPIVQRAYEQLDQNIKWRLLAALAELASLHEKVVQYQLVLHEWVSLKAKYTYSIRGEINFNPYFQMLGRDDKAPFTLTLLTSLLHFGNMHLRMYKKEGQQETYDPKMSDFFQGPAFEIVDYVCPLAYDRFGALFRSKAPDQQVFALMKQIADRKKREAEEVLKRRQEEEARAEAERRAMAAALMDQKRPFSRPTSQQSGGYDVFGWAFSGGKKPLIRSGESFGSCEELPPFAVAAPPFTVRVDPPDQSGAAALQRLPGSEEPSPVTSFQGLSLATPPAGAAAGQESSAFPFIDLASASSPSTSASHTAVSSLSAASSSSALSSPPARPPKPLGLVGRRGAISSIATGAAAAAAATTDAPIFRSRSPCHNRSQTLPDPSLLALKRGGRGAKRAGEHDQDVATPELLSPLIEEPAGNPLSTSKQTELGSPRKYRKPEERETHSARLAVDEEDRR